MPRGLLDIVQNRPIGVRVFLLVDDDRGAFIRQTKRDSIG